MLCTYGGGRYGGRRCDETTTAKRRLTEAAAQTPTAQLEVPEAHSSVAAGVRRSLFEMPTAQSMTSFFGGNKGPLSSDPEVQKFNDYFNTLSPLLYWTYLGLFIAIWCGTCCIVTASTWCCLVALCPSELVMSCKLCGGAC